MIPDQVSCAVIRYHSRRVTCLEFHPTNNNILLSGDKVSSLHSLCHYSGICVSGVSVWWWLIMVSVSSLVCLVHLKRKDSLESGTSAKYMKRLFMEMCTHVYSTIWSKYSFICFHSSGYIQLYVHTYMQNHFLCMSDLFLLHCFPCILILVGLALQVMVQYMLRPQMVLLVALMSKLELHCLWWTLTLMVGRYSRSYSFCSC